MADLDLAVPGGLVVDLPVLPDGLVGKLESFVRPIGDITLEARREIAQHMVRSLIPLAVEETA